MDRQIETKPTKKLRLSYSLINLWSEGKIEQALSTYYHMEQGLTEAMKSGKEIHKDIENTIKTAGQLPAYLSPIKLLAPKSEFVLTVPYNEQFDLKAIIDCLDGKTLYEFKTGVTESLAWSAFHQIPFYFLVCGLSGLEVEKAMLLHYNQHEKTSDFVQIWNGPRQIERARNFVDSIAPEILEFFTKEGLI